jgi:poly-beta-1,6-N-acetyl-D-glucosamine synthase
MLIMFFTCLGLLVYVFLGYPFILKILSLLFGKEVEKKQIYPAVSLIISAYNEQNNIEQKLLNSLELDYPKDKLEIIVASEATDNTNLIVEKYLSEQVKLYHYSPREGKSATLFKTVPKAKGEIIVFSDANAVYDKNAIKILVSNFSDNRIGCVSGQLKYLMPDGSQGSGEGIYWKYEMLIKKLENLLFSLLGANGSIFAIRKNLYQPISIDRGDDFELPVRIAENGLGVVLEPQAISWEKSSDKGYDEFKRKVRIISWNIKSCLILLSESFAKRNALLVFQLISHKLLRWLFPVFALGLLASNVFLPQLPFRVLLGFQILFYAAAALGFALEKTIGKIPALVIIPYYFCLIHFAALVGIYKFITAKQKTIWEKARG